MDNSMTRLQQDDQPCEPFKRSFYDTNITPTNEDTQSSQDEDDQSELEDSHAYEGELDSGASADVLADGSMKFFNGVVEFYASEGYARYKNRKYRQKCKKTGEYLWSHKADDLFLQMTMIIPPIFGKMKIKCKTLNGHAKSMGRNQIIAYLLERYNPPVEYTRKIVSSHKQVVKKLVAAGENQAALDRIERDPRIVSAIRSKDFYFDEASMTLRAGEIRHSFGGVSALSRFVPGLQLLGASEATQIPVVHSVDFNMGVYQRDTLNKDSTAKLIHACTTLQTSGGATAKSLEEILPFVHLYPSLQDILNRDSGCDILWFDSSIGMLEQIPTTTSHIGIEFKVDMLFAKDYTDWRFKTNFYHHSGQLLHEIVRALDIKQTMDAKVTMEISLFSALWVKLFRSRILKRKEAGAQYRKQLEMLQHGPCACEACLHLCAMVEAEVAAVEDHCRTYFQDMSIMQSIYAKPQGCQEHRCIAIFLFKFSQNSGSQVPLTTWHRVIRSDNGKAEAISEPSSILPTQPETMIGATDTEWQSTLSDSAQRDIQNSWQDDNRQNLDVTRSYLDGSHNSAVKIGNLSYPTFTTDLGDPFSRESFGNHVLATEIIGQAYDAASDAFEYSEMAYYQEPPLKKFKSCRTSSHQEIPHLYLDDPTYRDPSANIQFHDIDLANFDVDDFSVEAFNDVNQMIDAHTEVLHFDFNQPPTMPLIETVRILQADQDNNPPHDTADTSGILPLESRSIDDVTNLLSPTTAQQELRENSVTRIGSPTQLAQATRERSSPGNNCHSGNQEAIYGQHQDHSSKILVSHNTEITCSNKYNPFLSIYDIPQDSTYMQEDRSQEISPNQQTFHCGSSQQLSNVALTYGLTAKTEENVPDMLSQNGYLDGFDFYSYEEHNSGLYHVPPTPPPSQDLPIANMISHRDRMPEVQQKPSDNSPDWSASTDFDAHHWVVDLAIAKTEDMIEEAYANYPDEQNIKAIQGVADVEAMAAMLESDHQETELHCREVAFQPFGKILHEIDTNNKCDAVELGHHINQDSVPSNHESVHMENTKSEYLSQNDTSLSSTYFANDKFISQALLTLEESTASNMEWHETHQDYRATTFQKQITSQPTDTNSPSQAHTPLLIGNAQNRLEDPRDTYSTELFGTNQSTPEHDLQTVHYNSPQSLHFTASNHHHHHSSNHLYPDDQDYSDRQFGLMSSETEVKDHASMLNKRDTAVFTPQSIEVRMSDVDNDDLDLTERITIKVEEDSEEQSQKSYHVEPEHSPFPSIEQDGEWEVIKHEDATTDYTLADVPDVDAGEGHSTAEPYD